jgi:hypothetical protein
MVCGTNCGRLTNTFAADAEGILGGLDAGRGTTIQPKGGPWNQFLTRAGMQTYGQYGFVNSASASGNGRYPTSFGASRYTPSGIENVVVPQYGLDPDIPEASTPTMEILGFKTSGRTLTVIAVMLVAVYAGAKMNA